MPLINLISIYIHSTKQLAENTLFSKYTWSVFRSDDILSHKTNFDILKGLNPKIFSYNNGIRNNLAGTSLKRSPQIYKLDSVFLNKPWIKEEIKVFKNPLN